MCVGLNLMLKKFVYMKKALKCAYKALQQGEWPIGAVIVKIKAKNTFKVVASAYNQVERLNDATAHAEILAAKLALERLKVRYLSDCILFVTLQPCHMCLHFLKAIRIKQIIWGAYRNEACFYKCSDNFGGICENDAQKLLYMFGNNLRFDP